MTSPKNKSEVFASFQSALGGFPPARRWLIGYSGGRDSRVLLHLCGVLNRAPPAPRLLAVHVHHGLLPEAEAWAQHCERVCRASGVPFRLIRVRALAKRGQSPEEAARKARYGAFERLVGEGDLLLTAHHRGDQAETLLLQLFRGSGPEGLAAMPELARFGRGWLGRPLLNLAPDALSEYARGNRLDWIDDGSNRDPAYDRNYLRQRVMPLLEARWPNLSRRLQRSARHCAEASSLLSHLGEELLETAMNPQRNTLSVLRVQEFDPARQRLVLRAWIRRRGWRAPPATAIERMRREVLTARPDRVPRVVWRDGEVRRFRGELYLLPRKPEIRADALCRWDGRSVLTLPGDNGTLAAHPTPRGGISPPLWESRAISVRFRRGGESCRLQGRSGHHALKKLFQEKGVPPWVRERIPLVYLGDRLAAVGGLWTCEPFCAVERAAGVSLRWSGHGLGWPHPEPPDAVNDVGGMEGTLL